MNLKTIVFPVYPISKPITLIGKASVFINDKEEYLFLDDKSIPLPSLGLRRLEIDKERKLLPLNNAVYFLKDIIKINAKHWVDSSGQIFSYKRSKPVSLVFKQITKVIPIITGGALLEIDNELPRHKVMYAPKADEKYIGLLHTSPHVYLVYGLYTEKYKDTWRKI